VRAVNAEDWEGACRLTLLERELCERGLSFSYGGPDVRIKRVRTKGDTLHAELSLYYEGLVEPLLSPPAEVDVERHDDGYLVHAEVAVIR
jgi:hypothetical protein